MRAAGTTAWLAWLLIVAGCGPMQADEPSPTARPGGVLSTLASRGRSVRPVEETIASAIHRGDLAAAEEICRKLIADIPDSPSGYYNLACVLALQGKRDEAFGELDRAVALGLGRVEHMQEDPDLATLRDDPRFADLLARAADARPLLSTAEPEPYLIVDQTAWVGDVNTTFDPDTGLLRTAFRHAVLNAASLPITAIGGPAGERLLAWQQEGTAAGNVGDLYDNRDGDHSDLDRARFLQLTWIEYSSEAQAAHVHWGLQARILHDGVVLGNASVARTQGPFWRSMPRMAYENQESADVLYRQYRANKLYVYPGHLDHSPGHNGKLGSDPGGYGDVFPANTPYLIASQGSSGSDRAFLEAVAATLAAFRPETKAALAAQGLLIPAVQMIFRMANRPVAQPDDYLTGAAHPTVFEGRNLDVAKMVEMAHTMTPDNLPPLAVVRVVEEDAAQPGRDYFDIQSTEKLFDTPCAIARALRGTQFSRRMVVTGDESIDPHGKPLTFHWKVLRGDAQAIHIRPLDDAGKIVELVVPYHARRPIAEGAALESNRVDLALFVRNGVYYSPPAFITFCSLDHEAREYDAAERILSVTYTGADEPGNYTDPLVALPKSWKDEYRYDAAGQLLGWIRRRGNATEEFTADGRLILRRDDVGQPAETAAVQYVARPRGPHQTPVIVPAVEGK